MTNQFQLADVLPVANCTHTVEFILMKNHAGFHGCLASDTIAIQVHVIVVLKRAVTLNGDVSHSVLLAAT